MRRFYLHKRGDIFYAVIVDPKTKKRLPAKSTQKTDRDDAVLVVSDWLRDGIPENNTPKRRSVPELFSVDNLFDGIRTLNLSKSDAEKIVSILKERGLVVSAVIAGSGGEESLCAFLERFWTYSTSPYVAELHAHGRRMGRAHADESLGRVRLHWTPFFGSTLLGELTRDDLRRFSLSLADPKKNIAMPTRNRILQVGKTALRWAFSNGLIRDDLFLGLTAYSGDVRKRSVLSIEEARALFERPWKDARIKIANLLAATTGMRAAEIIALKEEDIGETVVHVRHSYSVKDKLKGTKTSKERRCPLLPAIRSELLKLAAENPGGFIFAGKSLEKPIAQQCLLWGLHDELARMSLGEDAPKAKRDEEVRRLKNKGIVFHSWRHFYAARLADRLDARKIMNSTGHKTQSVFEVYADHALESDLAEVGKAAAEVFGSIIPFTKAVNQ